MEEVKESWLVRRRRELREEKERLAAEIASYPAHTEILDGREFRVIRIPDHYAMRQPLNDEARKENTP